MKYSIELKIVDSVKPNTNHTNMCTLCKLERLHIALADKRKNFNEKNQVITECLNYWNEYFTNYYRLQTG